MPNINKFSLTINNKKVHIKRAHLYVLINISAHKIRAGTNVKDKVQIRDYIHWTVRRLTTKSREVSKPRYWGLDFSNHSEICQAPVVITHHLAALKLPVIWRKTSYGWVNIGPDHEIRDTVLWKRLLHGLVLQFHYVTSVTSLGLLMSKMRNLFLKGCSRFICCK